MRLLDAPGQAPRYSLLSPEVMGLIQSGGPRVAPAPAAPSAPQRGQPGFLTYLLEGREGVERERMRPQMEAERQQRQQIMANLTGMFGGLGGAPAGMPPIAPPAAASADGAPLVAAMAPAPARRGLPSLREAAPILMAAELAGIDGMAGIRSTLEAVQPDIDFVNGMGVDRRDPTNVGRRVGVNLSNVNGTLADLNDPTNANRFIPDIPEGAMPLYDDRGQIVAIRNIDGAVQAIVERERATNDARNASTASYARAIAGESSAGSAPYEFVNVPTPSGAPAVISRAEAAGRVFQGQAPSDAIRAEGVARNEVAAAETTRVRASSMARMLPTLANMQDRLPNVIAGFGADQRLDTARGLAALGNKTAIREVTATQTFQNEARQVVALILPSFGANPTEGERKYAEQMSGADVTYTPEALAEGIRLAGERAAREISAYEAGGGEIRLTPTQARMLPSGTPFTGEDGMRYRVP